MRSLLAPLGLAALLAVAAPAPLASGPAPGRASLAGLTAEATVVTDRWGIPHLSAANLGDLYEAWGWVSARDRLWQMVHTRAAAEGTTHRWLGNAALKADGGAQAFRLRERAAAIWARERRDPAVREALTRYAAGVNAWLADCRAGRRPWPPELERLREAPRDWTPEDCVLVLLGFGITLDLDLSELAQLEALKETDAATWRSRRRFEGRWTYDTVPDSATLRIHGPRTHSDAISGPASSVRTPSAPARAAVRDWLAAFPPREPEGGDRASNQFAVGAVRSASGRPLFANDPHLSLGSPGAFHVLHVSVPGTVDAIGAAVPGLPLIASGRNARTAWGVTAVSADVLDIYADTLSQDLKRVRTRSADGTMGWAPVVTEPFDLRFRLVGSLSVPVPMFVNARRRTPHGPVLVWDAKRRIAYSARWTALEDDRITLTGVLGLERSRDAHEAARRAATLVTPCLNLMAADVDGAVVYRATGLLPVRPRSFGPGPAPSDGRHEWTGFVPTDSMPHWQAPSSGYAVNANNRPAGRGYPYDLPGYDWAHDRARRIAQRLETDRSVTLADLASVQSDVHSLAAERLLRNLIPCADSLAEVLPARSRAALDTLRAWDHAARRERVAPTLYRAWTVELQRRLGVQGLPGLALASLMGRAPEVLAAAGDARAPETPAVTAAASLAAALDTLTVRFGPDMTSWRWGRVHRARFRHPLSALDGRARWEPPLTPMDGDNASPSVGPSRLPASTEVVFGPVYRHVVDLAQPDRSYGVVPPLNGTASLKGTDADHRTRWARHGYVPFLLDPAAIAREARDRMTLVPEPR